MSATVNGVAYDFVNVEVNVNGETYVDVSALNYEDPLKPGRQYGTHPEATGRTTGRLEPTASMTIAKAAAVAIRASLGQGFKTKKFDIVVHYAAEGHPIVTDQLVGVRLVNNKGGGQEGSEGISEEWELDPQYIVWNGLRSIENPLYGSQQT